MCLFLTFIWNEPFPYTLRKFHTYDTLIFAKIGEEMEHSQDRISIRL